MKTPQQNFDHSEDLIEEMQAVFREALNRLKDLIDQHGTIKAIQDSEITTFAAYPEFEKYVEYTFVSVGKNAEGKHIATGQDKDGSHEIELDNILLEDVVYILHEINFSLLK